VASTFLTRRESLRLRFANAGFFFFKSKRRMRTGQTKKWPYAGDVQGRVSS
jgi:hypothetical protein